LGCKYNLNPNKPALRIAKRTGVIIGGTLLMPFAIGGIVIGFTVILASFLIYKKCKK